MLSKSGSREDFLDQSKKRKKFRYIVGTSLILFISLLIYLVVVPTPVKVDAVKVQKGDFQNTIKVDGILRAKDRYIVPAFGEGDIKRVAMNVGDPVKKGQAVTELFWSGEYLPVKSPIDGVVSKVFRESAGPIHRGEPLVEVVDPKKIEIMAELLTTDAIQVDVGDEVFGEGWGGEGILKGNVVRVSKAGFIKPSALGVEEEKTEVVADISGAPPGILPKLGSNFHLVVTIEVEKIQNVLKVPIGAIFRSGKNWSVYKIIKSKAVETPVKIKFKSSEEVVVEKGLSENDEVIIYPGDLIRDGTRVRKK